ncbi:MAG: putative zinc-binding protein [Candidatus Poribacteria bacterium]
MPDEKKDECCCGGTRLVFPCSGAADVGAIADQVGRKMTREGLGNMYCLAGIGGHVSGIVETTKAADEVITIDGCPIACATKSVEHIGITPKSFEVTKMGFEKYKTPITEEAINKVYSEIKAALENS